ncbi:MAG: cell division protein FtsZ [Bacteroidales bacterium]|nr:cell division protein FtsZ [Bacteroidales bacterium]
MNAQGKPESFEMPTIIKVVGVGGGGSNAINHMYAQNVNGVSFVVLNTDRQALNTSPVPNRLLIGPKTCGGLGAGNMPEVAREAALESADEISALFDDDTKMVFITAGMGGGTGTGAAPVVAKIARDKGILTIGIVTIPFLFEGPKKVLKALDGADEMQKYVDALLIINNERLTEIYPDLDFDNAFGKADDTLTVAARSISELITTEGRINLDFKDVNTTLRDGGVAIISTGYGEGEKRVTKAIEDALNSPLLKNRNVDGSKTILVNIYYSRKSQVPFKMAEIDEMSRFMTNISPDVDVIWGVAYDDTLDDQVKITILAAGFDVSLEADAPAAKPSAAKKAETEGTTRIEQEYGGKATQTQIERAEAKFFIFKPEDLDNDEIIDLFEETPSYNRDQKLKNKIEELRSAASTARPAEQPAAQEQKKTTGTISFGG